MAIDNDTLIKELADQLRKSETSKKTKGIAKTTTIAILIIVFIIGILASFGLFPSFAMGDYVDFLEVALWPLLTLIVSIGVGSVVKPKKDE